MGILSRSKDIMASNINAIFNKEDKHPEKTINKYLQRLKDDRGQVSAETEAIKVEAQRARMAYDENIAEQEKLQRYIDKSNASGDTAGARQFEACLERVKSEGEVLKEKYDRVAKDMNNLSQMDEKLSSDIAALESKLREIKVKTAGATKSKDDPDKLLAQMNEKADYMMDKANAMEELNRSDEQSDYDDVQALAEKYDDIDE